MSRFLWHSQFSGGGGSTKGAIAAGFEGTVGIEWDEKKPEIAELYAKNCGEVIYQNISEVHPLSLKEYFPIKRQDGDILVFQTSPPCQEYSNANQNKSPDSERALVLQKTWKFYSVFKPEYVILENVPAFIKAPVYLDFKNFLLQLGYEIGFEQVVNCADYGVPQTRKRLIMIAVKEGYPHPSIAPTHSKQQWIGWKEAIEDLLEFLPESSLTERQELSVADFEGKGSFLVDSDNSRGGAGYQYRKKSLPVWTLLAKTSRPKAVLVERVGYRDSPKTASANSPSWTLRACIADDGKGGSREKLIDAVLDRKVFSLNTRALARLQSFPDNYKFSGVSRIDTRIIGNSVPPKLSEYICKQIRACVES